MEGPGTEVVNERVEKVHAAIERGMHLAAVELEKNGMAVADLAGTTKDPPVSDDLADRLRRAGEEATRTAQRSLDGSLGGMYRSVEQLTGGPWDPSPERAVVASRADSALRAWGAGRLDDLIQGRHDSETSRGIARSVELVQDRSRGREGGQRRDEDQNRGWVAAANRVEDRLQKPILAQQAAETSGDFGPPADLVLDEAIHAADVAFGNEWQDYQAGRFHGEPTNIYAHPVGSRIAAAEPTVTLATQHSGAGKPTRDRGGVLVDAEGRFSILDGHNIETVSAQDTAERLGVSQDELERAASAASAGLAAAKPAGERAETLDVQEELEYQRAYPDLVAEAEIRADRAGDPTAQPEVDAVSSPGRGEPLTPLYERIERARDSTSGALSAPVAPQQSGGPVDGLPERSIDGPPQGIARKL